MKLTKLVPLTTIELTAVINAVRYGLSPVHHYATMEKCRSLFGGRVEQIKYRKEGARPTFGVAYALTAEQVYGVLSRYGATKQLAAELLAATPADPYTATAHNPLAATTVAPSAVAVIVPEAAVQPIVNVRDISINAGAIVDGQTIQTVNARDLHGFLQSGKDFSNWIKDRIEKYDFKDGVDFTTTSNSPNRADSSGGRQRTDYHVSLDMAKELAMVERTDKGKEARQYFIACEKKLLQAVPSIIPNFDDPIAAAEAWLVARKQENALKLELATVSTALAIAEPKALFADVCASKAVDIQIGDAAKTLGVGVQYLFSWLRRKGYTTLKNEPTAAAKKWLIPAFASYEYQPGKFATRTTYVTPEGMVHFTNSLVKEGRIKKELA